MKHLSIFISLMCLFAAITFAQPTIVNYQMGGVNSAAFTTNNFKCIWVGKGNRIWAGSQYGGLYTYDDNGLNVWLKSDKLTNVFINDIKSDADSGIWIAQSGQASVGGNSNIAGGVNYFPVASDISMSFYSVQGTTTSADLLSRNVRSLYVDQSYGSANGRLPRVWAAQGTYITSFNTKRGGLSVGLNPFATYFYNYSSGYATGVSATPISEAIGGNSQEVWIAARQNNGGSQILRYKPNGEYVGTHGTADTSLFTPGFTAQAIHFDAAGNRWIGLKSGGLIIKTPTGWVSMNSPALLPAGTQINYNAITSDEFGNVYIGTSTGGLLEYKSRDYNPSSSPDYTPSYDHYTTNEGLPSNNITGLAYDQKNGRLLITSDAGVTFMNKREPFIRGVVFDVYCNLDAEKTYPGLQKIPLSNGVRVSLLRNNVEEESVFPDANGIFELKEANETDFYTVEVRFVKEGKTMVYRYDNIRNHTLMRPVLMPDSLIREIKAFKSKMQNRCFPIQLGFQLPYTRACYDAFDVNGYDLAYQHFYDAGGVTSEHTKKVDNLANYYTAIGGVYALGGNATDLVSDMIANSLDMIEFLVNEMLAKDAAKDQATNEAQAFEQAGLSVSDDFAKAGVNALKLMQATFDVSTSKISSALKGYPKVQKIFDFSAPCINDAAGLIIEYLENGGTKAAIKAVVDNLKKIIANEVSSAFYAKYYAKEVHANLIYEASNSASYSVSEYTYETVFDNIYNPSASSLLKYGQDTLTNRKANITTLSNISKAAEAGQQIFETAQLLALIPGGQVAGAIAKALSYAAKAIKVVSLCGGIYQGAIGAWEETNLSEQVTDKSGLLRPLPGSGSNFSTLALNPLDSLIARKNRYNQELTDLQTQYNLIPYNAPLYGTAYKSFAKEDSFYTKEMNDVLNNLWSATDSAITGIPGFEQRLNKVIDSFITPQYTLRNSLYYMNYGFIIDSDKSGYRPGLDSLAIEIKRLNDSAVSGLGVLISLINTANIPSVAFLVQEDYQVNHSHVPGTSGSVTYSFKNYGGAAQNNVSFKISRPSAGYTITSADSVNVGTINPGQTKSVTYNFTAPSNDSVGHYQIVVKASNGIYKNVNGTFYTVDPAKFYTVRDGDWNNASTWHSNQVPGPTNKVHISHNVTVSADVTCKSVTVFKPGNVTVNTGKRIIINN